MSEQGPGWDSRQLGQRFENKGEFRDQENISICDKDVFSVNAHCVKKSLLREPNLTLTKFVKICRAAESSRDQLKVMSDSDSFAVSAVKRSGPPGGHSGPSGGHGSVSGGRGGACTSRGGGRGGHNSKKSQSQAYARSNILVILMLNRTVCSQKSSNSLLP